MDKSWTFLSLGHFWVSVFSHIPLKNTAYIGEYLRFRYRKFLVTVCSISDWDVFLKNTEVWASNPCSYFCFPTRFRFTLGTTTSTTRFQTLRKFHTWTKNISKIEMAHQMNWWQMQTWAFCEWSEWICWSMSRWMFRRSSSGSFNLLFKQIHLTSFQLD